MKLCNFDRKKLLHLSLILMTYTCCFATSPAFTKESMTKIGTSHSEISSKYDLKWKLTFGASSYNTMTESSHTAQSSIKGRLNYQLTSSLRARTEVSANLGTGRTQSRFGDITPSNSISLSNAYLHWNPIKFLSLKAGAINQKHLHVPLLVSSRAFPAVIETVRWQTPTSFVKLRLQQAIPSSTTLSTKAVTKEKTPTFYTESLIVGKKISKKIEVQGFLIHYQFNNLPNTVIEQSSIYGNSINFIGPNSPQNQFIYQFNGLAYGGHIHTHLNRKLSFKAGGYIIENQKAPISYRLGREAFSEIYFRQKSHVYSLTISSFFNESDTSPSYYNSSNYGHNNRNGYSIIAGLQFPRSGFKIAGGYTQSHLINSSAVQENQSYYFLKLETLYEKL